jgi:hypothetical protein
MKKYTHYLNRIDILRKMKMKTKYYESSLIDLDNLDIIMTLNLEIQSLCKNFNKVKEFENKFFMASILICLMYYEHLHVL